DAAVGARKPNGRGHASPPNPLPTLWRGGTSLVVPPPPRAGRGGGGEGRHVGPPPLGPRMERQRRKLHALLALSESVGGWRCRRPGSAADHRGRREPPTTN